MEVKLKRNEISAHHTVVDRLHQKRLIWYGHLNKKLKERWPKQFGAVGTVRKK